LKSLKYHGNCPIEDCTKENIEYLEKGLNNLYTHVENIKNNYNLNVIVAINKYNTDIENELNYLCSKLKEKNIEYAITDGYSKGSNGSIDLANKVLELSKEESNYTCCYELNDDIKTKINKVTTNIYRAKDVIYSDLANQKIELLERLNINLPICIAKTQYSLSDDPKNLDCNNDYYINVEDIELKNGAGYIVVLTGKILTMPGLPKVPNAINIDVDNNEITGIF